LTQEATNTLVVCHEELKSIGPTINWSFLTCPNVNPPSWVDICWPDTKLCFGFDITCEWLLSVALATTRAEMVSGERLIFY